MTKSTFQDTPRKISMEWKAVIGLILYGLIIAGLAFLSRHL